MKRIWILSKFAVVLLATAVVFGHQWLCERLAGMPDQDELFVLAITTYDAAAVDQAIQRGICVNSRDARGVTPLHHAAGCGNLDAVRRLIGAGAQVNAQDSLGRTPLMCAAQSDNGEVIAELVSRGADPSLRDSQSRTVLAYATADGQRPVDPVVAAALGGARRPANTTARRPTLALR